MTRKNWVWWCVAYAATLLLSYVITFFTLTGRAVSGGHGMGGVALLAAAIGISVVSFVVGLVLLPFRKPRPLAGIALAGGLGAWLGVWIGLFEGDTARFLEILGGLVSEITRAR